MIQRAIGPIGLCGKRHIRAVLGGRRVIGDRCTRAVAVIMCIAATTFTQLATAQPENAEAVAQLKVLRAAAQKDKRTLVASTLTLTDTEAKKFWPVYEAYQRDLDNYRRERNLALEELVARDKPMTNRYAKDFTNELLKLEEQEIKSRRKMHNRVMRALPPKKAAQYLQIEFKLRAAQAYDIAIAFPLEK